MKKMILGMVFGILTIGLLAGDQRVEFSKFEYDSRGAPWEVGYHLTIDFDNRVLITQESFRSDWEPSKPKTEKVITLKPEEITELQKMLNSAGVTRWKDKNEREWQVCDGTFWDASYVLKDGTSRKIHGDNAWPGGIKTLSAALEKMGVRFIQ